MHARFALRAAIVGFLASRTILFAALLVISHIAFLEKAYSGSVWQTRIVLVAERVRPEMTRMVMVGDAWWYKRIAENGYGSANSAEERSKRAFFPLYPMIVRACGITGDFALDGVFVSNVAFLLALIALGRLALQWGLGERDVERVIFYASFFPTSYFFSLPMTESLFLLLSVLAVLAATTGRWWGAGLAGGLAAATRVTGILLLPVLIILLWRQYRRWSWNFLWIALVPAGLSGFMAYLYYLTGDALAFMHVQEAWGRRPAGFWEPLVRYVLQWQTVGEPWNLLTFNFAIALLLLVCAIALLVRRDYALGLYTLLSVLLPLSSGSLQSIGRYAIVVFPLYFWLAVSARSPLVDRLITALMVALFGWFLALFALRLDFTMA